MVKMPEDEGANGSQHPMPKGKELTEPQKKTLAMVKSKEVELRKWLGTRKDFTEEEKGALKCQTYKEFAQYWSKVADKEQQDLDKRHQRGWAKWSHGYQSFGSAVMGFMKDWEPIINIVKGFGGAYGDMAVGTISVVFVIAENKDVAEGYLSSSLASIKDRMIGFALYEGIYAGKNLLEDDLRSKIVDAYSGFIKLSIEATKYYKGGGTWRWLRTIGEPRKFKGMAENVEGSILAIRLRCEELLSRNVDQLKKDVDQLKKDNKELKDKADKLIESDDNKNMDTINQYWRSGKLPLEQNDDLKACRDALYKELSENFDQFRRGDQKRKKFEGSIQFDRWQKPQSSTLLVLIGHTEQSIVYEQNCCWLSPIVLDMIEERRKNHEVHAYCLLELLSFKKEALRKHISFFSDQDVKNIDGLEKASMHVIKFFESSETVHIMVDRVDRCEENDRMTLMSILGRMVAEAPCTVKVLIVISGSDWTFDIKEIDKKHRDAFIIYEERQGTTTDEMDY